MQLAEIIQNRNLFNRDAEMSVIGAFLIDNRTLRYTSQLSDNDFFGNDTRSLFRGAKLLASRNQPVDIITLEKAVVELGKGVMTDLIIECSQILPSAANTEAYIQIVRELSSRRCALDVAEQAVSALSGPDVDTAAVIAQAQQAFNSLVRDGVINTWTSAMDVSVGSYIHLDKVMAGKINPITSGTASLDKLIGGFFPGELTVIGARPGTGKSAFALNIAISAATSGKHVCFCSAEMSDLQLGQRVLSHASRVDGMKIRRGDVSAVELDTIAKSASDYASLPISFLFSVYTVEDLISMVRERIKSGEPTDMLVVDYLQFMGTKRRFESERLRVSYISAELKRMSKEYDIPVIALAQLRRTDKLPSMQDLKESGGIEQDADGIILMHMPKSEEDDAVREKDVSLFRAIESQGNKYVVFIVEKQRQGATGVIAAVFDPRTMRYHMIIRGEN